MFVARNVLSTVSKISCSFGWRSFCSSTTKNSSKTGIRASDTTKNSPQNGKWTPDATGSGNEDGAVKFTGRDVRDLEAYRDVYNLDFRKAAKILFSDPPNKKKFGLDFHLVQLFFVCLPSLAVYLVAQYARYEMRKMDAELELKKKAEEEIAKAKEMEAQAVKDLDPELLNVKERLEALEQTVKEIATAKSSKGGNNSSGSKTLHLPKDPTPTRSDGNLDGLSGKANEKEGEAKNEGSRKDVK